MARKVTIVTGQWADLPFAKVCELMSGFGYDGLEICTWGDHLDLDQASKSKAYCDDKRALLEEHGLGCWAIQNHLTGQLVCDNLDERHYAWAPAKLRGDAKAIKKWAIEMQKKAAKAAKNMGVSVVTGFTGSPIWHLLYSFPPCLPGQIEKGYKEFAKTWRPILDVYAENGVKFALEVHPTEIAFDIASAQRALDALDGHPAFGFNYDPSHFGYQGVDYVKFIHTFKDRIFHVHMKDVWWGHGDSTVACSADTQSLAIHGASGTSVRGCGDINFEGIIVALNDIQYQGPLSVEWEDSRMDRYRRTGSVRLCAGRRLPAERNRLDAQFDKTSACHKCDNDGAL